MTILNMIDELDSGEISRVPDMPEATRLAELEPITVFPVSLNPDLWEPCQRCGQKIDKCECEDTP